VRVLPRISESNRCPASTEPNLAKDPKDRRDWNDPIGNDPIGNDPIRRIHSLGFVRFWGNGEIRRSIAARSIAPRPSSRGVAVRGAERRTAGAHGHGTDAHPHATVRRTWSV
jgi:hypothetical protein